MPAPSISWTPERVEDLKRLHGDGLSASQIGREMNVTRNAIIGKASRLGLTGRAQSRLTDEGREQRRQTRNSDRVERQRNSRKTFREKKTVQEATVPTAAPVFIGSLNIPFADLRDFKSAEPNQCRFIAAEPAGPDYLACGNETLPGESYCGHCTGIVYGRVQINMSDIDREKRRAHFIKIGNASKIGRTLDREEEAA